MKKLFSLFVALLFISIDHAQNVGIGTATPVSKLEVRDGVLTISNTLSSATLVLNKANSETNVSNQIVFEENAITKWSLGGAYIGSAGASDFSIYNYNEGLNALTVLSSNNNVGIGTFTPGSTLEVAGQITITGGSPGAGKVLTSNDIGLASWQTLPPPVIEVEHIVGESYGGGIVFYVTPNGLHGLIAETQDEPGLINWYEAHNVISTSGTHSSAGQNYTDWRLPSKNELNLLYIKRLLFVGFIGASYWSSSEWGYVDAYFQNFDNGSQDYYSKTNTIHVRAVRSF